MAPSFVPASETEALPCQTELCGPFAATRAEQSVRDLIVFFSRASAVFSFFGAFAFFAFFAAMVAEVTR